MASAGEACAKASRPGNRPVRDNISVETIAAIQAKLELLTAEIAALKAAQN